MNQTDISKSCAGQGAEDQTGLSGFIAPTLACCAVVLSLAGLSHGTGFDPGRVCFTQSKQSIEVSEVAAGRHESRPADKLQSAGAGRESDESRLEDSRQGEVRNVVKAKEENENLPVAQSSGMKPAPAPASQDLFSIEAESIEEATITSGRDWSEPAPEPFLEKKDRGDADNARRDTSVAFQPASGYWKNTYIPGDPAIRLLRSRLAAWDRSWLAGGEVLENEIRPVMQPFDAPDDNALALTLMADVSSVPASDNPQGTRMRLQVGIQGIDHRRGLRPAMTVAVVVDLPANAPDEVRIATRALLDAMLQSKQAGDRFSLILAGDGLVLEPDDFRFGSLQLAKQHILGESPADGQSAFSLPEAVEKAGAIVARNDEPGRPLGSSLVLLITAGALPDADRLAETAHQQARDGITLSVVPLGGRPPVEAVEKLVLAGLGNRRFLESPDQAKALIEEELHSASRAVARAARLSIRLAPGVHLVEVIGSEPLDGVQSQRVRDIELAMDQRLNANLGIAPDRGADEDGIQIVIPSIFSGDSVAVLLDVVAEGPGPIADVSLRYKDLVFLRNGSLQDRLELPSGERPRGLAQRLVQKNVLALHWVEAIEQAAGALGGNDLPAATGTLVRYREALARFLRTNPEWSDDADLDRDLLALDRYIRALSQDDAAKHRDALADSLHYAAWAKTHRPLEEWNR